MGPTADITDEDIARLVELFYAKVRRDEVLGPVFEAAVDDWPRHLAVLTDFWSSVVLSTGRYSGRPMQVHMRLPIRPEMFERWLGLWDETAATLFPEEAADIFRSKAARIAQSLQYGLFFQPDAIAPNRTGRTPAKV